MVELIVQTLLSKYLDPFFLGLTRKNINVQLLAGKLTIFNIGLNPQFLISLNLPIQLRYSYVEKLQLIVPWRKDEVTLTLNISNIYAMLVNKQEFNLLATLMAKKCSAIKNVIKNFLQKAKKGEKSKTREHVQNYVKKLLDNVEVNVGCIHLRYESQHDKYSFGLLIRNIQVLTVDSQDNQYFFNRDKSKEDKVKYLLTIEFLGIYFNSKEKNLLAGRTYAEITKQLSRISVMDHNTMIARRSYFQEAELNFIISISVRTDLKKYIKEENRNIGIPLYECSVDLQMIELKITQQQYNDIRQVINFFLWYQNFWNQYIRFVEINPIRIRPSEEISNLLTKKCRDKIPLTTKQSQFLQRIAQKMLGWVFKQVYQDKLKKSFLINVIKQEVTIENIMENDKLKKIIKKVKVEKLQQWVETALKLRGEYESSYNFIIRGLQSNLNEFCENNIQRYGLFHKYQEEDEDEVNEQHHSSEIVMCINVSIRKLIAEISKEGNFGIGIAIKNLGISLNARRQNFYIELQMQDLKVIVFSAKQHQYHRTQVSVVERSLLLENQKEKLLYLRFEKNPFGQPFIFSQTNIQFKPIQISIYPQAFRQFYEILFSDFEKLRDRSKPSERIKNSQIRSIGIQRNKIRGKVSSPWIVFPISQSNDRNSQCWVVRLGDLVIETPDYDPTSAITDKQLYYEHYKMQLRHFDLKFFSSIHYFHTWIKFNKKIDRNSSRLHVFDNEQIIDVINPFSCFVDLLVMKRFVSQVIRDRKQSFVISIQIKEVVIRLSKYLLNKMKERFNLFDKAGKADYIETNIKNLLQDNQIKGFVKVTYGQMTKTKFLAVLKANYIYFFLSDHPTKYHFFIDICEHTLKIISNVSSTHNQGKNKKITLHLIQLTTHSLWKKHLTQLLTRNDKVINTFQPTMSNIPSKLNIKHTNSLPNNQISQSTKMNVQFSMGRLCIKLINEDVEFLCCKFQETMLLYKQMRKKEVQFSLREWLVEEVHKQSVFLSSNHFFKQQIQQKEELRQKNFLDITVNFNEITNQFQDINVKVENIFIAWKVDMFTKILVFFFYDEQFGDSPAAPTNRSKLTINLQMNKFNLYCYHEDDIVGLIKLFKTEVKYDFNEVEEYYDMICQKFEMDKYIGNQMDDSVPMIISKPNTNNQMHLHYSTRRQQLEKCKNVMKLKKQFGDDLIVPQFTCTWRDTIIYYEHEQTLRLLNYFLNKILDTIGAKFKKKIFSKNFIFQTLKLRKLSIFDVLISNLTLLVPPHDRITNLFEINMQELKLTKNINPAYSPREVRLKTQDQDVFIFYETMVYQINNCFINHKYGVEPSSPITINPFNLTATQGRVRFPIQYFPILKDINDYDRLVLITIDIKQTFQFQLYKIYFITLLQVYYQNIKHKDGKADLFEYTPYPALRDILFTINKFNVNFYESIDGKMKVFNQILIDSFQMQMKQNGPTTNTQITFKQLISKMEMPILPLCHTIAASPNPLFIIAMESQENQTQMSINISNYELKVCMDKVQNILNYIKYNNELVSNQIMPKKKPSLQIINLFPKNCMLRIGDISLLGNFCISYKKNLYNSAEDQVYECIGKDEDIIDRDLSVNSDETQCYINGDSIGTLSYIYFRRSDWSSKATFKQFRKECIHLGEFSLYLQLSDINRIYSTFQTHIRKNQLIEKQFYDVENNMEEASKNEIKRIMNIQITPSSVYLMSTLQQQSFPHFKLDLAIPSMIYATYNEEQEIKLSFKFIINQLSHNYFYQKVFIGRDFKFSYVNLKDKNSKNIIVENAKDFKLSLHSISPQRLTYFIEDIKTNATKRKFYNFKGYLTLKNQTNQPITIKITPSKNLSHFKHTQQINIQSKQSVTYQCQPVQMIQIIHNKTLINIDSQSYTIEQIQTNQYCWKNYTINFNYNTQGLTLIIVNTCIFTNHTNNHISINQHRIQNNQNVAVDIQKGNLIRVTIQNKTQELYLGKSYQQLFSGYLFATIKQEKNIYVVQLFSKYSVDNQLPIPIQFNHFHIPPYSLYNIGFRSTYPQITNTQITHNHQQLFTLNLVKMSESVEWERNNVKYKCKIKYKEKYNQKVIITLYSPLTILNKSTIPFKYKFKRQQHQINAIKPNQYQMLPQIQSIYFVNQAKTQQLTILNKKKIKTFIFQNQFIVSEDISSIGNLLLIQNSILFINKTQYHLHFINLSQKSNPNETIPLYIPSYFNKSEHNHYIEIQLHDQSDQIDEVSVQERLVVQIKEGIIYLANRFQIFKIQIIHINNIELTLESSEGGYKFINQFQDFILTIKQQHTHEQHLIKPQQTLTLGLLSNSIASSKTFEVSFYYQKKNVDFSQNCLISIDNLPIDYSQQLTLQSKGETFKIVITFQHTENQQYLFKFMRKNKFEALTDKIQKLNVEGKQISLTIQLDKDDSITFQLCGLQLFREKEGNLTQRINAKVTNMLLRQGRNQSIIKFINNPKVAFSLYCILTKSFYGNTLKYATISLAHLDLHPRQCITSKILKFISKLRRFQVKDQKQYGECGIILQSQIDKEKFISKTNKGASLVIIQQLQINSTTIYLAYTKDQYTNYQQYKNDQILKYFMLVPAISEIKLSIPRTQIKQFKGQIKQFGKTILREMKGSIGGVILSSLNSLSLLDNPMEFSDNLIKYMVGLRAIS